MSRKTKEEAEKTRKRILASALSLFVKKGYERTTFNDIAARLKLTKGAVYWHFASKEALLVEIVSAMMERFAQQIAELMPKDELTFPAVAEMMVKNAGLILDDPRGKAFFMLMMTQIKWGDATMSKVREYLISRGQDGPYHAFIRAIANDKAAGRVRADADPVRIAASCVALWDGLVRGAIENLLETDLMETLQGAYDAFWQSIKA